MNFVFFSITEHPWGREMLSQLIDSGFIPSLIIEENSDKKILMFVRRKETVDEITDRLKQLNFRVAAHQGTEKEKREIGDS